MEQMKIQVEISWVGQSTMVLYSYRLHNFVCVNVNTFVNQCSPWWRNRAKVRSRQGQGKRRPENKILLFIQTFLLKIYQRYFVDLFSIDLFHSAVVDAVDGEVHEEDCQKVVGGSRGATVTKIQNSDVFTSKTIRNWAWGHNTLYSN